MARHRSGDSSPAAAARSRAPRPQDSPRRRAREDARQLARQQARAERARRGERTRARRARQRAVPLAHRLGALPWVSLVLAVLVVGAVVDVVRQDVFVASSTITATTSRAAEEVSVQLTRLDLTTDVEREIELEQRWAGSLDLSVERPDQLPVVIVRAEAPDPRLAALAADTAAAMVVAEGDGLSLAEAATVPTRPVDGGTWVAWLLGGAAMLTLAVLVERWHARREQQPATGHEAAPGAPARAVPVGGHR